MAIVTADDCDNSDFKFRCISEPWQAAWVANHDHDYTDNRTGGSDANDQQHHDTFRAALPTDHRDFHDDNDMGAGVAAALSPYILAVTDSK
jgi:hypothetical protein